MSNTYKDSAKHTYFGRELYRLRRRLAARKARQTTFGYDDADTSAPIRFANAIQPFLAQERKLYHGAVVE